MENNKINIAEILKDKPKGTKLYSPIFGDVTFDKVEKDLGEYTIFVTDKGQNHQTFMADGRYNRNGVPMLFPSKEMRDWSKFAWEKGDVLVSNDGLKNIIFVEFTDDTYTSFKGKHSIEYSGYESAEYIGDENSLATQDYHLKKEDAAKWCYINTIEKILGGKLNMETLEIEKKPKWTPKPFDKVLVRDYPDEKWRATFFSHFNEYDKKYVTTCMTWMYCIPYNEKTAKLLGTTNSYEED